MNDELEMLGKSLTSSMSKEEYMAGVKKLFSGSDLDGDGALNVKELALFFDYFRAGSGGMGESGGAGGMQTDHQELAADCMEEYDHDKDGKLKWDDIWSIAEEDYDDQ